MILPELTANSLLERPCEGGEGKAAATGSRILQRTQPFPRMPEAESKRNEEQQFFHVALSDFLLVPRLGRKFLEAT